MVKRLSFPDRLGLFLRSFGIQGSWSFRRMQSLGFFSALSPFLRKRACGPEEAAGQEMAFFNTHPVMASFLLGAVARLEEEGERGKALELRKKLMGPLGALGDGLFWAFLRPLAALAGVTLALWRPWAGVAVFLLLWNIPHLTARWVLLGAGYEHAFDAGEEIARRPDRDWPETLAPLIPILAAFLLGLAGTMFRDLPLALVLFGVSLFLFSRGWGAGRIVLVLVAVLAVLALAFPWMGISWSPWP